MSPDDRRHGTEAGHEQHRRDDEEACDACVHADHVAARRRHKRRAMGYRYTVPLGEANHAKLVGLKNRGATWAQLAEWSGLSAGIIWTLIDSGPEHTVYARTFLTVRHFRPGRILTTVGVTRRIRALAVLGYSTQRVAEEAGVHPDTVLDARTDVREFVAMRVREQIADAYDRLHLTPPATSTSRERAGVTRVRNDAARNRWAPPLAWDNIDDPDERPQTTERRPTKRIGRPEILPDVLEDFDWLVSCGESEHKAAERVGVTLATIRDYRTRAVRRAS